MQEDGEETKGLAKRAVAEGLDVTKRKADVTFMRVRGEWIRCASRREDGLTGVRASVRKCLSILDRQFLFQSHGYGMGTGPERLCRALAEVRGRNKVAARGGLAAAGLCSRAESYGQAVSRWQISLVAKGALWQLRWWWDAASVTKGFSKEARLAGRPTFQLARRRMIGWTGCFKTRRLTLTISSQKEPKAERW